MIPLSTAEIAAATGGTTDVVIEVTGIATDSRQVTPGDLFVALPGARADGAAFTDAALAAGAAAALVPRANAGPRRVWVDDPLVALGQVAALVRQRSFARVVGITGSTGKPFHVELDRRKAIFRAVAEASSGDVVVVAGKGHETYQIVGAQTFSFDDREVAREALAARRKARGGAA